MSGKEESAAQKAARLRRERRAKIQTGGSERLQRITGLSGRPASFGLDASPSPPPSARSSPAPPTPTTEQQPQALPQARSVSPLPPPRTPNLEDQSPENLRAQEEYLRALLRSQASLGGTGQAQAQSQQDPTAKLLSAFLADQNGTSGDTPSATPGLGEGPGEIGMPEFSPTDMMSALGIPGPLASLFSRQAKPETPEEQKQNSIFKIVHLVLALVMAWYLLATIGNAVSTYGVDPPPPSTAQNPFVMFMTLEAVLAGIRVGGRVKNGQGRDPKMWMKVLGDVSRDAKILVFVLGMRALFGGAVTVK